QLDRRLRRTLQAVDATIDGLAVYRATRDDRGTVTRLELTFINAAGARGFAGDRSTLLGRDLADFLPRSRTNGLWDALVSALDSGVPVTVRLASSGESWAGIHDSVQVRLDGDTVFSNEPEITE